MNRVLEDGWQSLRYSTPEMKLFAWLCMACLPPVSVMPQVKAGRLVRVCPQYRLTSSSGQDPQMHAVYPAGELPARVRDLLAALRRAGLACQNSPPK